MRFEASAGGYAFPLKANVTCLPPLLALAVVGAAATLPTGMAGAPAQSVAYGAAPGHDGLAGRSVRRPCRIAPSGLPKPQPSAKNPCLRIRDVRLRGRRLRFAIRLRRGVEGEVWATVKRPGLTRYLRIVGGGAAYRARGIVSRGRWTIVVHFKPHDNRVWRPVIARRRLAVGGSLRGG